uniref:Uncharacterized protein n=1 Tax=Anguilla anguilla TaxID=7936 RepID=A0A0E9VY74_ANGAN
MSGMWELHFCRNFRPGKPVAYFSRMLNTHQKAYSTMEKGLFHRSQSCSLHGDG